MIWTLLRSLISTLNTHRFLALEHLAFVSRSPSFNEAHDAHSSQTPTPIRSLLQAK